jgi:hypothetical protein
MWFLFADAHVPNRSHLLHVVRNTINWLLRNLADQGYGILKS